MARIHTDFYSKTWKRSKGLSQLLADSTRAAFVRLAGDVWSTPVWLSAEKHRLRSLCFRVAYRSTPSCSVFTAEAVAICRALKSIDSNMPRKYCIYTDSMSVLEALENFTDRCHPVRGSIGNDISAASTTAFGREDVILVSYLTTWQWNHPSGSQQLDNKLHFRDLVIEHGFRDTNARDWKLGRSTGKFGSVLFLYPPESTGLGKRFFLLPLVLNGLIYSPPHRLREMSPPTARTRGSLVVTESDRCWRVTSSSPIELKTRRVVARCTLNLSRAQMFSHWCGMIVSVNNESWRINPYSWKKSEDDHREIVPFLSEMERQAMRELPSLQVPIFA
ncbi:pggt1b [Trichonephila clavipes]|nr:pggt1b [Trichonephila clavipes]